MTSAEMKELLVKADAHIHEPAQVLNSHVYETFAYTAEATFYMVKHVLGQSRREACT